jgi:hypothetical protein
MKTQPDATSFTMSDFCENENQIVIETPPKEASFHVDM